MERSDGTFPRALLTGVRVADLAVVYRWYATRGAELEPEELDTVYAALLPAAAGLQANLGIVAHPISRSETTLSRPATEPFADLGQEAFRMVDYQPVIREETSGEASGNRSPPEPPRAPGSNHADSDRAQSWAWFDAYFAHPTPKSAPAEVDQTLVGSHLPPGGAQRPAAPLNPTDWSWFDPNVVQMPLVPTSAAHGQVAT